MYRVFSRTWWRENAAYPNGLEPCAGRKRFIARNIETAAAASDICRVWCANNPPGRYSLKAEYEEQ